MKTVTGLVLGMILSAGQVVADSPPPESPSVREREVIAACLSKVEYACEIFDEYFRRNQNYHLVEEGARVSRSVLRASLFMGWKDDDTLEGSVTWSLGGGREVAGPVVSMRKVPADPAAYLRLIDLALHAASFPESDQPFLRN